MKSASGSPVVAKILAIVSVLGQRGLPSGLIRLLGLNVVGSSPARRASPETDMRYLAANRSIARQTLECVRFLGAIASFPHATIPCAGEGGAAGYLFCLFSRRWRTLSIMSSELSTALSSSCNSRCRVRSPANFASHHSSRSLWRFAVNSSCLVAVRSDITGI
jgi:hypothetical protein